jgi:hypothetical protein
MAKGQELERLFITLVAEDERLLRQLETIQRRARAVAEDIGRAFEASTTKGFVDAGAKIEASAVRQKRAVDPLKEALERVKNETAALRNTVEAGLTPQAQAIQRFRELQESALRSADGLDKTSKEYRGFTQAAAQASRSIATLQGQTTKLGFSANNAIGVAAALRQNLGPLGPAATAASQGLGILQGALGSFGATGPGIQGVLQGLTRGFQNLAFVLPLVGAAAAGAALAGMVRLASQAAKTADEIDKGSRSAGLSVEAYQELRFAFDQNGVAAERFDLALQTLNRRLGQAASGQEPIARAFTQLGVAIRDNEGAVRSTEAVFTDLVGALSRIESPAQQAAAAASLFGDRVAASLIPTLQQGVEGLEGLRTAAREAGLVISGSSVQSLVEFQDAWAVLEGQLKTARTELAAGFVPVLKDVLLPILQNTIVPALTRAADAIGQFAVKLGSLDEDGEAFRRQMIANVGPLVSFGQVAVGVGLSVVGAFQTMIAGAAQLGAVLGTLIAELERDPKGLLKAVADGLNPFSRENFSGSGGRGGGLGGVLEDARRAGEEAAQAYYQTALNTFSAAGDVFKFDLEQFLNDLAKDTNRILARGAGNIFGEVDPSGGGQAERQFLEGSLARLRQELNRARESLEEAGDDTGRAFFATVVAGLEDAIREIEARIAKADPFGGARAWTERLARELRFGVKTAEEVIDLITPRIESLRAEAANILVQPEFDAAAYADVVGKLDILENLLRSVGKLASEVIAPDTEELDISGSLALLDRQLAEARRAFRAATSDAAREAAFAAIQEAEAAIAAIERLYESTQLSITPTVKLLSDDVGVSLASLRTQLREALRAYEAAFDDAGRAAALTLVTETQNAIDEIEDRFRLVDLTITPTVTVGGEEIAGAGARIREEVARRLEAAAAAARVFGTESELAAVNAGILAGAIQSILADDASADVSDLAATWREFTGSVDEAASAAQGLANAQGGLDRALERIAVLTGTAQTELDKLRDAVITAFDFGVISTSELDEFLAIIEDLPNAVQALSIAGIGERLARDLLVAEAAARAFGEESEGAAEKQRLLEAAIRAVLALDPAADVSEWVASLDEYARVAKDASDSNNELAAAVEFMRSQTRRTGQDWDALREKLREAAKQGEITREELERLLKAVQQLQTAGDIEIVVQAFGGLAEALEGLRDGNIDSVLQGLTQVGTAIGFAIGGPAGAAIAQAIGQALQTVVRLGRVLSDLFTGDSPARRQLAKALSDTVAGAFRTGILDGIKGADGWQDRLRDNVQDAILTAIIDAFIQAAIIEAIFKPFIDQFTRLLNRSGADAAFDFFDREFEGFLESSVRIAEEFVRRARRVARDYGALEDDPQNLPTGRIDLPNATVSVLAAPAWALRLDTAAQRISEAGDRMIEAAVIMQDAFRDGITVNTQSSRGIDAARVV